VSQHQLCHSWARCSPGTELSIKEIVSWTTVVKPEHFVPQVGTLMSWVLKRLVNGQLCHFRARCSLVQS
jgi:hypothetical protein